MTHSFADVQCNHYGNHVSITQRLHLGEIDWWSESVSSHLSRDSSHLFIITLVDLQVEVSELSVDRPVIQLIGRQSNRMGKLIVGLSELAQVSLV